MPLDTARLQLDFLELFTEPPDSFEGCADKWADICTDYLTGMTQLSTSPDLSAARVALKASLLSIFETNSPVGVSASTAALMETAFSVLGLSTSLQIISTGLYTSAPPVDLVGFVELFATAESSAEAAAEKFATAIDTWARTGTTTLIASPFTLSLWI